MAQPPRTDEAFLREVDEELRRDQLMTIWRRYGRWILGAVVAALIGLAGFLYWQHSQAQASGKAGETLDEALKALGENKVEPAQKKLAEISNSSAEGYRASAKFTEADIFLQKDDLKRAAAKFAEVANDGAMPKPFRDLALIRQTAAEYDSLKPQQVIDRLAPFAVKDSPWLGSAGEMVAAARLKLGQRDQAGKLYGEIARTEGVPPSLRQRAVQMAGVLGVDAVVQTEEKKAQ